MAEITIERTADGIVIAKEKWLDEFTKPEKVAHEKQREIWEYLRKLEELNESKSVQIAALQDHARKLDEQAILLQQQVEERAQECARETDPGLEEEFGALVDQWRAETMHLSSTTEKAMNLAYQQIIGMGKEVLPLILRELQYRGGHWFWALSVITRGRENPVRPEDRGNVRRMAQAWLEWGRLKGYLQE
ncbi:MAG: hypothetical protein ACR2G4_00505 [Pyrinomonadaceae bacterium]